VILAFGIAVIADEEKNQRRIKL